MIPFTSGHRYFVYSGIVDFRKGYNGLSGVVKSNMESNPFNGEELPPKCGTTKNYIYKIENNANDIRLSTLKRIIKEGLGGHIKLSLELLENKTR